MSKQENKLYSVIAFILLPLSSALPYADYILVVFIGFLLLLCIKNYDFRNSLRRLVIFKGSFGWINLWFCLLYLWFTIDIVFNGLGGNGIIRIIQLIGCHFTFNFSACIREQGFDFKSVYHAIMVVSPIIALHWLAIGHPMSDYRFIYGNPNTFGSVLLPWIFIISTVVFKDKNNRVSIAERGGGVFVLY